MHAVCLVLRCNKLQNEITLITTKSEYITLNESLCNVLPYVALLQGVSFILDINPPEKRSIVRYLKKIIVASLWINQTSYLCCHNKSQLSIIILEDFSK